MTAILIALNLIDVVSSIYAIDILGFVELNPLAASFTIWLFVLKFAACFFPVICACILRKTRLEDYLFMPFAFLTVLVCFYAFVVGSNVRCMVG